MKKLTVLLVVAVAVAVAGNAWAGFGDKLGRTVKSGAKKAGASAAATAANKELDKKTRNCKFKANSTDLTCDINDVVAAVTATQKALEGFRDTDIVIEAHGPTYNLARDRAYKVRDKVRVGTHGWDVQTKYYKKAPNNYFKIYVRAN